LIDDIACVILAGGKSSRMKKDKALLSFGSYPTLTQYQLSKFQNHFKDIYISCKDREKFDFNANFIEDEKEFKESAPFIAILSAFNDLKYENIFFISVDVPFFGIDHFERLYEKIDGFDGVVAKSPNGIQPLCAIYNRSILPHLMDLINKKSFAFAPLYEQIDLKFVVFEDEKIFTNLNTQNDYKNAIIDQKERRD